MLEVKCKGLKLLTFRLLSQRVSTEDKIVLVSLPLSFRGVSNLQYHWWAYKILVSYEDVRFLSIFSAQALKDFAHAHNLSQSIHLTKLDDEK